MNAWRSLVLVALLVASAVPAMAGRSGQCPYRNHASFQMVPRGHWAYEAVWELGHGSALLGDYEDQATAERFSRHALCRFHFAKLTARILKHRAWRLRGEMLTPEMMERLAALVSEFRYDFAMMGGDPERLDLAFADVLREEHPMLAGEPVLHVEMDAAPRRSVVRHHRRAHPPVGLMMLALVMGAACLVRFERRAATSSTLLASQFTF